MKKLKVCAFLGSPRKKGNTGRLLQQVLREAERLGHKTELVYLADKNICECRECFACQKTKDKPGCTVRDDMQEIYPKILSADCILVATPVFCWSFSALAKSFLDRTYSLDKFAEDGSYTSLVEGKKCGLIVTAAGDEFDGADLVVEGYCRMVEYHRMKDIGHLVAANIRTEKDLLKPEFKERAKNLARSIE
ncbi:MAG: flavodoxin family protein [Candidatus Omnitrophota bacterium]